MDNPVTKYPRTTGALTGAAIGTVVLPVPIIGTAVGAWVGSTIGHLYAEERDEAEKKAAAKDKPDA